MVTWRPGPTAYQQTEDVPLPSQSPPRTCLLLAAALPLLILPGGCVIPLAANVAMQAVNTIADAASEAAHEGPDSPAPPGVAGSKASVVAANNTVEHAKSADDQSADKGYLATPYPALHRPPTRQYSSAQRASLSEPSK